MTRSLSILAVLAATTAQAETSTVAFLDSCRLLDQGRPGGETCEFMLEGAIGAFSLLGSDYMPASAGLGYCLDPFLTAREAAGAIVRYAELDTECENLSHFSMCMNAAFQATYPQSC